MTGRRIFVLLAMLVSICVAGARTLDLTRGPGNESVGLQAVHDSLDDDDGDDGIDAVSSNLVSDYEFTVQPFCFDITPPFAGALDEGRPAHAPDGVTTGLFRPPRSNLS
jgi:hypothetical protein